MCTTRASACEVCAALGCSNAFRFGIVWFYVFLIWVAAAIAATAELIIRRQSGPRPLTLRRGLLLIAFPVAGLAGVHFLLLAALPVFVWPYLKKHDAPGPTWFRHFSRAVAIVLALSILPAYWMFPVIPTEGDIHARVSQTRANMKQLGGRLDQMASEKGLPPSSTEVAAGQTTFSVLNPSSLTQGSGARLLLEDPFANPPRQAPLIAIVAVFFPRSLFDPSWRRAYTETPPEAQRPETLQYFQSGAGYAICSRGPDYRFSAGLASAIDKVLRNGSRSGELAALTYDPTNGVTSPGDIFLVRGPAKP